MASLERILGIWAVMGAAGAAGSGCANGDGRQETSFGSMSTDPMVTTVHNDETTGQPSSSGAESTSSDESSSSAEVSTTNVSVCGDGVVADDELCDDGNVEETDECLSTCVPASCGDGFVQADVETCDDGNLEDTDECTSACVPAACGDGFVQADVEECDDGNDVETDDCLMDCDAARCGDGVVQEGVEACDDGNLVELDTCSNTCESLVPEPNCKAILAASPGSGNGVYTIDPDGAGGEPEFKAYCDMTQDGGGWTLILNRRVDADNAGQPDLTDAHLPFDNTRASDWSYDIDMFWADATQVVFADKQNDNCSNCPIAMYHSAIRVDKPALPGYSNACAGTSDMVNVQKLVGPMSGTMGTAFQCGASLGWGNCAGVACHFGVHSKNTATDGDWGTNMFNEMHFPSSHSSFAAFGDAADPPTAYRRGCGGGLASNFNSSSSCGSSMQSNAKARWTIWVR